MFIENTIGTFSFNDDFKETVHVAMFGITRLIWCDCSTMYQLQGAVVQT